MNEFTDYNDLPYSPDDGPQTYEAPEPTPAPPKPKTGTFLDLTRDEVAQKLDAGELSEAEVEHYVAVKDYEENGLFGLDAESVDYLWQKGLLKDSEVEDYIDKRDNPKSFYFKDMARGVGRGVQNIVAPIFEAVLEGGQAAATMHAGADDFEGFAVQEVEVPEVIAPTKTAPGKIVEVVTEFGLPFATGLKALRAVKMMDNFRKTTTFAKLTETAPGLANYLSHSTEFIVAGGMADFAQDPRAGHLSDFMADNGLLPDFMGFMRTQEDSPAFVERLKNVLEGAGIGAAFDAVLAGAKLLKRSARLSKFDDPEQLEIGLREMWKAQEQRLIKAGMSPEQAAEVIGARQFKEYFPAEVGSIPTNIRDANFLKQLAEAADHADAEAVIKAVFRQDQDIIRAARGPAQTLEGMTERGRQIAQDVAYPQPKVDVSDLLDDLPEGLGIAHKDFHGALRSALSDAGPYGELFEKLREFGIKIKVAGGQYDQNPFARAMYNGTDNTITFFDRAVIGADLANPEELLKLKRSVAHEAIHGVLRNTLGNSPEAARAYRSKIHGWYSTIPQEALDTAPAAVRMKLKSIEGNFTEAATYALTDPDVAKFLHGIEVAGEAGQKSTLWQELKKIIVESLGFSKTKLDELTDILDEYVGIEVKKPAVQIGQGEAEAALKDMADVVKLPLDEARQRVLSWMGADKMTVQEAGAKIVAMKEFVSGQVRAAAEAAEKALGPNASFAEMAEAYAHARFAGELMSKLFGVRAEFGRGLGAFRRQAGGGRFNFTKAPVEELKNLEAVSRGEIIGALEAFVKANKDGKGLQAARSLDKLKGLRGALQFVQANLLWNWTTQAVNLMSNVGIAFQHFGNKALAGAATKNLDVVGKAFAGWWYGMKQALNVTDFLKSGRYEDLGAVYRAAWESRGILDSGAAKEGIVPLKETPGGMKTIWNLLTANFRLMGATDELFKQSAYWSQVFEDAAVAAKRQGKDFGEVLSKEMLEMSPGLHMRAWDKARELTLTEPMRPGTLSAKVNDALNNTRTGLWFKILAMPFYQVPMNLGKYAARQSPLGFLSKKVQEDIAAGGLRRAQAISGMTTGTALIGLGVGLAASGRIAGAVPKGQEEAWANEGKQAYSIKVGDKYYSLTRLDPIAMIFGTAANLWRLTEATINKVMSPEEEAHLQASAYELFSLAVGVAVDASLDKAFMQSTKQLLDAVSSPERMGEGGFQRLLAAQSEKFIPWSSLPNNWNQTDVRKEFFDAWDVLYKRIDPDKLVDRRNTVTGEPLQEVGVPIARGLQERSEEVFKELSRVGASPQGFPKFITKSRMRGAIEVRGDLDREEYNKLWDVYQRGYGHKVLAQLEQTIESEAYQKVTDPAIQRRVLLGIMAKGRSMALKQFLAGDTRVRGDMTREFERQAAAIRGYYLTDRALVAGEYLKHANGVDDVYDADLGLRPE